jgi:two-component system cell cycle sensor histidine kinase/response regulator CckA
MRNRRLFDASPDAVFLSDTTGHFLDCNRTAIERYGYSHEEILQLTYADLAALDFRDRAGSHVEETLERGGTVFEWWHRRKDGSELPVEIRTVPFMAQGQPRIVATVRDLTESKRAEAERERLQNQLRQAAKMESVGRLAGGVAHDFNNMLAVILGHVELAMDQVDPAQPLYESLQEIRHAAGRSAGITQQLLAFARRQVTVPAVLDLNAAVESMLPMLRRLVGEQSELAWLPGSDAGNIQIGPSQLDQVLINLCVNARDAIAGAGKVTIRTDSITANERFCREHEGSSAGEYVVLCVSDNGCGMAPEALEHLFEPFFTTKQTGKGTGLGLATVYGIARQNEGFVDIDSDSSPGTTVAIYLPRVHLDPSEEPSQTRSEILPGAGGTLLVVEDEPSVLRLAERLLTNLDYTVLTAQSPAEALQTAETYPGEIALLITDVIMPEMNGWELSERLVALRPNLKTLYFSGYPAEVISGRGLLEQGARFLEKPFTPENLATSVRAALAKY